METSVLIAILSGSAVAALISGGVSVLLWFLNNKKSKETKENEIDKALYIGVRTLLYDIIKQNALKYIERGYIRPDELEDLERDHKIYHDDFKGNGYLDGVMRQARSLPIRQGGY